MKARDLARATAVTLAVLAAGPVGVAMAEAPIVTIDSPLSGSSTNNQMPLFTGTTNDIINQVTLNIYAGTAVAGTPVTLTSLPLQLEGTWSLTPPSPLADGTYTAVATQTNLLMETGTSAPPVTFTVDTSRPEVSLAAVPSPTNDSTPSFSGSAGVAAGDDPSVTLKIYPGESASGSAVRKVEVAPTGATWTAGPVEELPDGTYTAKAVQEDLAGNTGVSEAVTFTVDTTAPAVAITAPANGAYLNSSVPTFSGNAGNANGDEPSVRLNIYTGASASGPHQTISISRHGTSSWTESEGPQLPDGTYTAQAEQEDLAGNTGKSSPHTFTVDTSRPEVSLAAVPSPTNDSTPSFSGSAGVAAGDDPSVTLKIYPGESISGSAVQTVEVAPTGATWTAGLVGALPDGTYTAQAVQEDLAGNTGVSEAVTFTVDTTAPAVAITSPANDAFLKNSKPTFSGNAGVASGDGLSVTLSIYEGASVSGSPAQTIPITLSDGSWTTGSTGPQLPDGTYTAQAEQQDLAGNIGKSSPHTFTIKTKSPVVTLNAAGLVHRGAKLATRDATPSFSGSAATASDDSKSVTLNIYSGTSASGAPVQEPVTVTEAGGTWSASPTNDLADGTYTAQAEQEDLAGNTGVSASSTFTVDTAPPHITLTSPAGGSSTTGGSQRVEGSAGTAEGDLPGVTIQLFAGATIGSQAPLESIVVDASKSGSWSAVLAGLNAGVYTVRAEQSDDVGNLGVSATRTFVLTAPAVPAPPTTPESTTGSALSTAAAQPPVASFQWFPTAPHVGEPVSLISTSTDASSPIAGLAWSVTGNGAFTAGAPALTTSFSTAGPHVVGLRVTDANGHVSVATETIRVTSPPVVLMQPFPIVRIAGSDTSSGVRLSLLTVQAPGGARIMVRCRGRGCPAKSESRVAASRSSRGGTVLVSFPRFERSLRAGAILEIRVSKGGEIGKYTSFVIHRGKPPVRVDACLDQTHAKPIACPP